MREGNAILNHKSSHPMAPILVKHVVAELKSALNHCSRQIHLSPHPSQQADADPSSHVYEEAASLRTLTPSQAVEKALNEGEAASGSETVPNYEELVGRVSAAFSV